jgi:hypothetical protein
VRFAPVRIAVAGAHSTGKSTFLSNVETRLRDSGLKVGRVADLAQAARDSGFPILRDHVYESTLWIMAQGMRLEMEASKDTDVVLVDRPVPDALGYLLAALDVTNRQEGRLPELYAIARAHSGYYDWIAYTVLDENVELGADRDTDATFRRKAGERIAGLLDELIPNAKRILFGENEAMLEDAVQFAVSRNG